MTVMAETATETVVINAPAAQVWDVVIALEHYPEWVKVIKDVVVRRPAAPARGRVPCLGVRAQHPHARLRLLTGAVGAVVEHGQGDIRAIDGAYTLWEPRRHHQGRHDLAIELATTL